MNINTDNEKLRRQLDDHMAEVFDFTDLPGLAVGVRILPLGDEAGGDAFLSPLFDYSAALGRADRKEKTPLATGTVFHMASIAKLFTATAVMQLSEAGALDIDGKLADYLPGFRMDDPGYKAITLRHILSHTSGFPDVEDYHWKEPETDPGALSVYARSDEIRKLRLLWEPSEGRFSYSNIGYDILGALIGEVSGQTFESYIDVNIFSPLMMSNSTFLTFMRTPEGRSLTGAARDAVSVANLAACGVASPHFKEENRDIKGQDYFPYNRIHAPSSTLTSTLADIKKWGDACLNGPACDCAAKCGPSFDEAEGRTIGKGKDTILPVSFESLRLMWTPQAEVPDNGEMIGIGWFIRKQGGFTLYGHEGADDGFRSSFWICPEAGIQITVLSNMTKAPLKKINKGIFTLLTD